MNIHNSIRLPVAAITADPDCQLRAACSGATVQEYSDALAAGATFPPIIVFSDGASYWLGDSFHRFEAHQSAGLTEINAEIRDGDQRDAKLFAAGANADHGLRRTQADKRRAILALLTDPEWRDWSDKEIARRTAQHPYADRARSIHSCWERFPKIHDYARVTSAGVFMAGRRFRAVTRTFCGQRPLWTTVRNM